MRNSSRPLLLAGFLIALAFDPIAAQEPTEAERDAIRSACRSDFMAHCSSVQPGGKEALECLLKKRLAAFGILQVGRERSGSQTRASGRRTCCVDAGSQRRERGKGRPGANAGRSDQSHPTGVHAG
jgi:hypothetical protein